MNFPIFKTKVEGVDRKFNLSDPGERKEYFEEKAGDEIKKLKKYFEKHTFIAYLVGKKNSGKGTYSKMFKEIFGSDKIIHISVGDVIRDAHKIIENEKEKEELIKFLKENYRGYISIEEAINALLSRDAKNLLPTEFILTLAKREIDKQEKKILFIDGFPRNMDQVSYSLFFRDLINYREDPDIFILIDLPEKIIDERIKYRAVCPKCQTPRNLKLFLTKEIGYDEKTEKFYLKCDNPECNKEKMVSKEGDELGIEPIRERLKTDSSLIEKASLLHGIPKIFLRNSVPVDKAKDNIENYETTPEYVLSYNREDKKVEVEEKPWKVEDENGTLSYSLLAPPVVLSMIKQMVKIFKL